jgi:MoaA/NifB/PqqE/SkfB family radical SAM enzyme/uncharacterized protein with ATP-grasp and redox domains
MATQAGKTLIDKNKKDELFGDNCIVILDSGDGHGSAYVEALQSLKGRGKLEDARYSIIVHADSPGWGLDEYPNYVFISYLKTINTVSPQVQDTPKVTIAAKNPQDKRARGRARVYTIPVKNVGQVPVGIKEWNELSYQEKKEARELARDQDPTWFTNANILICDTAWSYDRAAVLKGDYKHDLGRMVRMKRRPEEYWSSDYLNIAAQEYLQLFKKDPDTAPLTRLVYIGQDAPNANKTLVRALEYRDALQKMILTKIRKLGVEVDKDTTVAISSTDVGPNFDLDRIIKNIFGDNRQGSAEYGNTKLRGSIHLDDTVVVKKGAILDGRKRDVSLTGACVVERGVELHGVVEEDKHFEKSVLYPDNTFYITGRQFKDSTTEATRVDDVDFRELGLIVDDRTRIWIAKRDESESNLTALKRIFGSDQPDGARVTDQIFVYGDVVLDSTVRVENGTMLDGRVDEVILVGNTHVHKGINLKSVKANDTTFAGWKDLDIYHYRQPTHDGNVRIRNSEFNNAYIEIRAEIANSMVRNSYVANGAVVDGSDLLDEVVVNGEKILHRRLNQKVDALSLSVVAEEDGRINYMPGAFRLEELPDEDVEEILGYQIKSARKLYMRYISDPLLLERMVQETEQFIRSSVTPRFTIQQIRQYLIAKIRENCDGEPDTSKFRPLVEDLRTHSKSWMDAALKVNIDNEVEAKTFFRELSILATRANFIDFSIDPKLFDIDQLAETDEAQRKKFVELIDEVTDQKLAIDGYSEFENMVFSEGKGTFLFFTDNIGETEIDAVMWEFLARMGHTVVIAAKDGFSYADIDVKGVEETVNAHPSLREHKNKGRIRVISSGSMSEGVFPHKFSDEVQKVFYDSKLKGIIAKGQANLFTLPARNKISVPVVVMCLSKSMTSKKVTGISVKTREDGRKLFPPMIAVVPDGENVANCIGKGVFGGKLARFGERGQDDPDQIGSAHAFTARDGMQWARQFLRITALFTFISIVAIVGSFLLLDRFPWNLVMLSGAVDLMLVLTAMEYYLIGKETYNAIVKYIFEGRASEDILKEDAVSEEQAMDTKIAEHQANNIIRYHPAFRYLSEHAQETIKIHESFEKHRMGMLAMIPVFGRILWLKLKDVDDREMLIHSDYSNIEEVLRTQLDRNVDTEFLKGAYRRGAEEVEIEGTRLIKLADRSGDPDIVRQQGFLRHEQKVNKRCTFCDVPDLSAEAHRSKTAEWAFSVEPSPVFSSQIIAINARHIDQNTTGAEVYYDMFQMLKNLKRWQVSWPSRLSTNHPDHFHVHMFERDKQAPVEEYETVPICRDRKGAGVVHLVKDYPDRDHAIAAFSISGSSRNTSIFAKRCADLEAIIRSAGYEVDKFISKGPNGAMKVFFYPRTAAYMKWGVSDRGRLTGPIEMSGIWVTQDDKERDGFGLNDVREILSNTTIRLYGDSLQSLVDRVQRHFYESEGIGLLPSSMDLMVTYKCNLNCPVCWGSYMPKHKIFAPDNEDIEWVDFKERKIRHHSTGQDVIVKPEVAHELEVIRQKLSLYYCKEPGSPEIEHIRFFDLDRDGTKVDEITVRFTNGKTAHLIPGSDKYQKAVLEVQKRMIDVMHQNGMRRMVFTGGEPLIEDNLAELLKYAKDKGITTWLFTNGLLMDEEKADQIMPYVDMISLSLDGYDDATNSRNRKSGHFAAVLSVLSILSRKYPEKEVQILTVVTERNREYIRKIGFLLRQVTKNLERFQWKLNYYKRIGRSQHERDIQNDVFLMEYGKFKDLALSVQKEFTDIKVRYSPPDHDKAYLFVFPDGTLSTTVGPKYLELGNILDEGTLTNEDNVKIFKTITDNIRRRAIYIPSKGAKAVPDFKRRNVLSEQGLRITEDLVREAGPDIYEHTLRVQKIAMLIAQQLIANGVKIDEKSLRLLSRAALAHDIGAREKYNPAVKDTRDRITAGIHKHPDDRVEMTQVSLTKWASTRAHKYPNIPKKELMDTLRTANQTGDYYPVYRMYIKYVTLGRQENEPLTMEEEMVSRNLYNHGQRSIEILRENMVEVPIEFELLIKYHHDYNSLEDRLQEMVEEQRIDPERSDQIKLLSTILIVSDVFEQGNNYRRLVEIAGRPRVENFGETFDAFNGFMWKRFHNTEHISDTRAIEALKELLVKEAPLSKSGAKASPMVDADLAAVISEARKVQGGQHKWLTSEDKVFQFRQIVQQRQIAYTPAGFQIAVGMPSKLYDRLDERTINKFKDIPGIASIIKVESSMRIESMMDELSRKTYGSKCISALISEDVIDPTVDVSDQVEELEEVLEDFVRKAAGDILALTDPRVTGLTEKGVRAIDDMNQLKSIMGILIRALPHNRSYELSEKSIRQIRIENAYRAFVAKRAEETSRVEYLDKVVESTGKHYLAHFADGQAVMDGKGAIVIPPGLEIRKRREMQGVDRMLDDNLDRFYIVAPENVKTDDEKDQFKRKLMETWMLDGVVSAEDVIILDRKSPDKSYSASELYKMVQSEYSDATSKNTGIRCIKGHLEYDNAAEKENILQIGIASEAISTVNMYEVFVNLLLSREDGDMDYTVIGLQKMAKGLYIYLPFARPLDLEKEIRHYHDRFVKEVLIKA